ncbi:TPA: DNA cytosine methyltransferase [Bacillus mobilis]|uniref:DNA cytosine methyltransferase n=1 Tax=Bacillus mobilis TaxID=2026190 RepID=UPI0011A2EA92|nr:DNA cytosine methyltransferase [Bacillus mobilis]MED4384495.1 DNA cytosine methyltransferase [Bacillus mobilis]HDX9641108.1 DNA (cytosine-5-)-methyltransferase [Bacillus mobilis]
MSQYNLIDIFAGCGGLSEGFEKKANFNMVAAVEWEKPQVQNLINRLVTKWKIEDADKRVLRFDIQRTEELFNGWINDPNYGTHEGLDKLLKGKSLDLIIGGPPCQAYSVAGRIRDENGMRDDYRNYLFESYLEIVRKYQPKLFVFENVPGILSAKPGGTPVTELMQNAIEQSGYEIVDDLKSYAQIDLSEYGVPQKRKRVIIIGLRKDLYPDAQKLLKSFYVEHLPKYKESTQTVNDTIKDLPRLLPLDKEMKVNGKKISHSLNYEIPNHLPRFHSKRDIGIFKLLAEDIENGRYKYTSSEALKQLYTQITGKNSNVHKYHVLRWDQPSNTIPAHLYKDGLRHIHPDSTQARTITVREAARLQTFDDDYEFISSAGDNYKMIGNAVPPKFSGKLAEAIEVLL